MCVFLCVRVFVCLCFYFCINMYLNFTFQKIYFTDTITPSFNHLLSLTTHTFLPSSPQLHIDFSNRPIDFGGVGVEKAAGELESPIIRTDFDLDPRTNVPVGLKFTDDTPTVQYWTLPTSFVDKPVSLHMFFLFIPLCFCVCVFAFLCSHT